MIYVKNEAPLGHDGSILPVAYMCDDDDATTCGTDATTATTREEDASHNNMTLKAAVQSCWPNETPLEIVRLIKRGCIEVLIPTSSSSTKGPAHPEPSEEHWDGWTTVRQHGKRMIRPNQYLRRRIITDDNNNRDYDVRMLPSHPIVVVMNKPSGCIVTSNHRTTTTHPDEDCHRDDSTDTLPLSSSMSVYDL